MELIRADLLSDINLRLDSIKKLMKGNGMDAILVASNANIFYTSARFFRGYVYIPCEGEAIWFVISPDIYDGGKNVIYIRKPEMIPADLTKLRIKIPECVGLEFEDLTYSSVMRLQALFPGALFLNGSAVLKKARMVKTPWELSQLEFDGIHQAEAYRRITHCLDRKSVV